MIHGFPTCSYDYRYVVKGSTQNRRVLLIDLVGFGLSAEARHALLDRAVRRRGHGLRRGDRLERLALMTHDMGDTVGGELLARQEEGRWPIDVTGGCSPTAASTWRWPIRHDGQNFLLALPDEAAGRRSRSVGASSPRSRPPWPEGSTAARRDLAGDAELICRECRQHSPRRGPSATWRIARRAQERYTGAIETHSVPGRQSIWGADDPIAVREMAIAPRRRDDPTPTIFCLRRESGTTRCSRPRLILAAVASILGPAVTGAL